MAGLSAENKQNQTSTETDGNSESDIDHSAAFESDYYSMSSTISTFNVIFKCDFDMISNVDFKMSINMMKYTGESGFSKSSVIYCILYVFSNKYSTV